jgi:hypothetical protein
MCLIYDMFVVKKSKVSRLFNRVEVINDEVEDVRDS